MSRGSKKLPSKPSQAYLVSFGDTMTALLAFFIVLNSLAKEQTGANLHAGTGSFVSAVRGMGVPGWFKTDRSRSPVTSEHSKPTYFVDDDGNAVDKGNGPDKSDNGIPVQDRQREQVQRIVNELDHLFPLKHSSESSNAVSFDIFESLNIQPNILGPDVNRVLLKCLPAIKKPEYRIEVIVWTPTPSPSAWSRSALLAEAAYKQVVRTFHLSNEESKRIACVSRVWISSTEKRPIVTVSVSKRDMSE